MAVYNAFRPVFAGALSMAICLGLAGCNSSTTPAQTAAPLSNISGDYTGTMQDAQAGSGTATATLAQQGGSAGGQIVDTRAGVATTAQISLSINSANTLTGAMVINNSGGTTCTFKTTGTYTNNGSSAAIAGSYTAVTNCAGDSGTFTLNQQCVDTVTSVRRRSTFPAQC